MGLNDEIAKFLAEAVPSMPDEVKEGLAAALDELRADKITSQACRTGDKAPDFTLPNHNGQMISTEALRREGPLVLNFYRGSW